MKQEQPNSQWASIRLTLPWGLVLGILAGGVISTGFDPVLILVFLGLAAMRCVLIYLVYVAAKRGLYQGNPLPVMSIALATGFAITFAGSFLVGSTPVFEILVLIAIVEVPVYIAYSVVQFLKKRRHASAPVRNFARDIFAIWFVMAPLLFFLAIPYWSIVIVILNSIIFINYFRERRKTGPTSSVV